MVGIWETGLQRGHKNLRDGETCFLEGIKRADGRMQQQPRLAGHVTSRKLPNLLGFESPPSLLSQRARDPHALPSRAAGGGYWEEVCESPRHSDCT